MREGEAEELADCRIIGHVVAALCDLRAAVCVYKDSCSAEADIFIERPLRDPLVLLSLFLGSFRNFGSLRLLCRMMHSFCDILRRVRQPLDAVPEEGQIAHVDLQFLLLLLLGLLALLIFFWLFAEEAAELFQVDVTVLILVILLELALVLARIHLDSQAAQRIVAASFSQALLFILLIKGLVAIEDLL